MGKFRDKITKIGQCEKVYQLEKIDFFKFSISRFSLSGNFPAGKPACMYICADDVLANDLPSSVHEEIPHDYQVCTIMIIWHKLTMFICINSKYFSISL